MLRNLVVLLLALCFASPVFAEPAHGTKEEAKAMAEKAATILKANLATPEKAVELLKNKEFVDRDLYVFVLDGKGKFIFHATKPALVGKEALGMKDVTGFAFMKAFLDVKDTGWVDYKWPDPTENDKIKDKSSYVIRAGEYALGVGYYK